MKMEVYRPVPILVKLFVDPPKVLQRPKWHLPHSNLDLSLVPFQERKFRFLKEFYGVHVAVMFSSGKEIFKALTSYLPLKKNMVVGLTGHATEIV